MLGFRLIRFCWFDFSVRVLRVFELLPSFCPGFLFSLVSLFGCLAEFVVV